MRPFQVTAALALALACAPAAHAGEQWIASWGTAVQGAYPVGYNVEDGTATLFPGGAAAERTLRMIVRPSLGGSQIRVRLSNAFGHTPLRIGAVTVGVRAARAAILPGTLRTVTFGGAPATSIPAGEEMLSDPVPLAVGPFASLAVSVYLPAADELSWHAVAFTTSYVSEAGSGDNSGQLSGGPYTLSTNSWLIVDGIDVLAPDDAGAVVAIGDSITDGHGSTRDGHDRWTDVLATRLNQAGSRMAVINKGINGNHAGPPSALPTDGPSLIDRLDRDVLAQSGVRAAVVSTGSNDLFYEKPAGELIAQLESVVARLRARGLVAIGATVLPRGDGQWTAAKEAQRQAVNEWIRRPGSFDRVADFDAAVRTASGTMNPRFDSGDQVHPNPAGYRALAEAVDLHGLVPQQQQGAAATATAARRRRGCAARTVRVTVPARGARRLVATADGRRARIAAVRGRQVLVRLPATRAAAVVVRVRGVTARGHRFAVGRRVRCVSAQD